MVSNISITFLAIAALIVLSVVVGTFIHFRRKEKISIKAVLVGAVAFILFSQVLEKALHMFVIKNNFFTTAISFTVYGALAAGIFEECGRFIMFKTLLKDKHEWRDGIAFGIGQGGIEAILIGVISAINYIVMAILLNSGTLEQSLAGKVPAESITQLKTILTSPPTTFLAMAVERPLAFTMQIGLSILVLQAVRYRKNIYLLLAIILHAIMDVPAALYQTKIISSIWIAELLFFVYAIISVIYIIRSKDIFKKDIS